METGPSTTARARASTWQAPGDGVREDPEPQGAGSSPAAAVPPETALRRLFAAMTPLAWLRGPLRDRARPPEPVPPAPVPCPRCSHAQESAPEGDAEPAAASPRRAPAGYVVCPACRRSCQAQRTRWEIWGESWADRVERRRRTSPFGRLPSWRLRAVVVKGSDSGIRQELLATQIISQFHEIWQDAGLPLWLRKMEVLCVGSNSGMIEFVHDAESVDKIKKRFPGKSLAEIFRVAFADRLFEAKRNFIESCAAYSLVIWFLQVKDRHNGNLMMDSSGHLIHIDFGFMLSNPPGGNVGFESSPFKLTQEFLDVMEGEASDQFEYFQTLVIRGFLQARRHLERVILPIRMQLPGSKVPAFRAGAEAVLQGLHDRFFTHLTEEACVGKVMELIEQSQNNWRTVQYDNYQRITNGIL